LPTGLPLKLIEPVQPASRPASERSKVDFPQPLSPTIPRVSPLLTVRLTPRTTWLRFSLAP
jgi:hypothetical protein